MLIHLVTDHSDYFSHSKCGKDRTDSDAEKQVTDDKINYPVSDCSRQHINPHLMYIKHFAECKSNNKTEKIRCDKFFSHDHQG